MTGSNGIDQLLSEPIDLDDQATRARLSPAAFRAFDATAEFLSFSMPQRCKVLGDLPDATYRQWMESGAPTQTRDSLERISLVLGVVKSLRTLFADDAAMRRWLANANHDAPFDGTSPLDRMLRGSTDDLKAVRRYLAAWLGELT